MLPYALNCGMTAQEFWYGEPRLLVSFIKKHELELDEINYKSWLNGLYVYKAVGTILSNCFANKEDIKEEYFDKPIEELNSNYEKIKENTEIEKENTHRNTTNYWAKFGKKGS